MVAMNSATYAADIAEVRSGGYLLYDSSWPLDDALVREDVNFLGVPLARMSIENFAAPRERILMKNIAYAGSIVALLGIEVDLVSDLLERDLRAQREAARVEPARAAPGIRLRDGELLVPAQLPRRAHGRDARAHPHRRQHRRRAGVPLRGRHRRRVVPDHAGHGGHGQLLAAVRAVPARELTPAGEGTPATYQNNYLILQAEDEIAAIGMVLGASWSGARAFTSTSGPGISLMGELLGLAYYTEIPAVVVDVQRTGPSTGMPTRTQQADILACAYASHGDTRHILLSPRTRASASTSRCAPSTSPSGSRRRCS